MPCKRKLQTYIRDDLYRHLQKSAKKSNTSVSMEASRLLELTLLPEQPQNTNQSKFDSRLIQSLSSQLQDLQRRVRMLESSSKPSVHRDPSYRGRRT